jgi:hypothetical protein
VAVTSPRPPPTFTLAAGRDAGSSELIAVSMSLIDIRFGRERIWRGPTRNVPFMTLRGPPAAHLGNPFRERNSGLSDCHDLTSVGLLLRPAAVVGVVGVVGVAAAVAAAEVESVTAPVLARAAVPTGVHIQHRFGRSVQPVRPIEDTPDSVFRIALEFSDRIQHRTLQ